MENFSESDLNLTQAKSIYLHEQKTEVYVVNVRNQDLVIKKSYIKGESEANTLLKRILAINSLDHDTIAKIKSVSFAQDFKCLLIVMDYYCDGELGKEIRNRASSEQFWSEDQILIIFQKLVSGFIYMQKKKMVHRDIRPENILKKGEEYFITDFGFIIKLERAEFGSIAGNPAYASPKLAEAFKWEQEKKDISNFSHNAYKSDVFSLGLTFLYMATFIQFDQHQSMDKTEFENKRSQMVDSCIYSEKIKNILSIMLEYDENKRPDFLELRKFFRANMTPITKKLKNANFQIKKAEKKLIKLKSQRDENESEHSPVPQINILNPALSNSFIGNDSGIRNIEICFVCEQSLEIGAVNVLNKNYKVHPQCLEGKFKVEIEELNLKEFLIPVHGNQVFLNSKVLKECTCGIITYKKPALIYNVCLKCFKNWEIDYNIASNEEIFYKILSLHCNEVCLNQICSCNERSVEVNINGKHYLCFECLEKHFLPLFHKRKTILCPWRCCLMEYSQI